MSVFATGAGAASVVNYVEYIQSDGLSCVDTGFNPNQNTRVVMDMICTANLNEAAMHFGSTNSGERPAFMSGKGSNSSWKFTTFYNNTYAQDTTVTEAEVKTRGIIDQNRNSCTWGRVSLSIAAGTFQINYPMFLFGVNAAGALKYASKMRLYSCQIYDDDILIRDYWPCYDRDGVACLYEKVEKKYYYNAGTGSFTAGGAV